ncbi:hypothetical protein MKW92_024532 [Papaver armeniacum]|nr:hypothetical protein MKW92_024532 [Papaver armeniacum]
MVDAVVSFAVQKLGDALITKTYFLLGVRTQVKQLHAELIRMQCFLKDADAMQQGDNRVQNWVSEIRNLAYDAEDVIDTYIFKVDSTRKTQGIRNFLYRKASMPKNMVLLHRVGKDILDIQARLKSVSDSRNTYGIRDLGNNENSISETTQKMMQLSLRNRYPHVVDDDVIGFEEHTKTLLTELMKDEERRCVVSVVGVGGLGKTTLAKKIYRHDNVKSRFQCCGWSSISQQLNVKDVLEEIVKCMSLPFSGMSVGDLMKELYIYLQDKRYFIVLDDVWKVNDWNTLKDAFPAGKRGSKVLLTTRRKDVASHADPDSLHLEPRFLNDEESWELLCRKAFPRNMVKAGCYPTDLEKLGREMVAKCGGLPLGICVLGGLLATKRSEIKQWELVRRNVISYLNRGEDGGVSGILALSYHDLPTHLKPCFLYLGLFPEDRPIPRKKLIQLWIAEGFISHTQKNSKQTLEDIAKHQYLAELIQRCMVQAGKEPLHPEAESKHQICRVHDLMRDLCLSKGKEINFSDTYNQQYQIGNVITYGRLRSTNTYERLRRCAIDIVFHHDVRYEIDFDISDYALRTLLVEMSWGFFRAPFNYQHFKLLRVLDLENCSAFYDEDMTEKVSKLIHLRYLGISLLPPKIISSSIGNLRNLQILKLGSQYSILIPETVTKLEQLRHLIISGEASVAQSFRVENLVNLQTIYSINAGEWIRKGCFERLTNLRKLGVYYTTRLQTNVILEEIVGKRSSPSPSPSSSSSSLSFSDDQNQNPIRSLLIATEEGFPSSIFESLSCCHNLHTLKLNGSGDIFNFQKYPPNLTKLNLINSSFTVDPMATLERLSNLRDLNLSYYKYQGEEMVCSSQGFPQLQHLSMIGFEQSIKDWKIDQGGMPRLKELHMDYFAELSRLPEGLRFITTLERLVLKDMPAVKERVVQGVGEDWYKIQHIPFIDTCNILLSFGRHDVEMQIPSSLMWRDVTEDRLKNDSCGDSSYETNDE